MPAVISQCTLKGLCSHCSATATQAMLGPCTLAALASHEWHCIFLRLLSAVQDIVASQCRTYCAGPQQAGSLVGLRISQVETTNRPRVEPSSFAVCLAVG
jgi:hypothetical protein